jgi:hypothetical protein
VACPFLFSWLELIPWREEPVEIPCKAGIAFEQRGDLVEDLIWADAGRSKLNVSCGDRRNKDVRIFFQIAHDFQKLLILCRVLLELELDFVDEGDGLGAVQFITVGHFDAMDV